VIGRLASHLRDCLGRGLLIALPLLVTLWLLSLLFGLVTDYAAPVILAVLAALGFERLDSIPARVAIPIIGLLVSVALIYLVGLLAANLVGRRILSLVESAILRVPLVKGIYGAARQLLDAFATGGGKAFSRVVLVEYPRPGLWTLGFVTAEFGEEARVPLGGSLALFLPTTPNPTSGWLVFAPREQVVDLAIGVEEGIKLVVSGGIVCPPDLGIRGRQAAAFPSVAGLASRVGKALADRGLTVATAESCTGGLLGGAFTAVAGSSGWYRGSVVAYQDDLKVSALGLRQETLDRHGAVSEEAAREMAAGVRARFGADYGIGVTGIAGPSGGSEAKPVGLVYIAVAGPTGQAAERRLFPGDREAVRAQAVRSALELLDRQLGTP